MEYNSNMLAYDVPLSALLYILWAGVPVKEYIYGPDKPTEDELEAYISKMNKIIEDENDGL